MTGLLGSIACIGGGHVELDTVRREILDQKGLLADRRLAGVGMNTNRPKPRIAVFKHRSAVGVAPNAPPVSTRRRSSTPSGRVTMKVSGSFSIVAADVAGQRGEMHGFAGAVDAAFGQVNTSAA